MYIGDADVPLITEEGWSQERSTEETINGVAEFEAALEAGDISFVLHQNSHDRSESLKEQRNAIYSLLETDAAEHPFEFLEERGHLAIESAEVPRPSETGMRQGTISVRYLPDSRYQPAVDPLPVIIENDFSVTETGVIRLPGTIDTVFEYNNSTNTKTKITPVDSLTTANGTVDFYSVDDRFYLFESPVDSYASHENQDPVRIYDHNNTTTESDWTRVYQKRSIDSGIVVTNGFLRVFFGHPTAVSETHLEWYDGSAWISAGTINVAPSGARIKTVSPRGVTITIGAGEIVLREESTAIEATLSGLTNFELDTAKGDEPADSGNTNAGTEYMDATNVNISENYFLAHGSSDLSHSFPRTDGSGNTVYDLLRLEGLNGNEYTVFAGLIPGGFTNSTTVHRAMTRPNTEKTLIRRQSL